MDGNRAILHIDMDAFYASVEVLDDPTLKGKPVIVGGTPEGRGVVSAASYEARAFGVHSAMSAAKAVKLCPDGVFLRGRMDRYAEVSNQILEIFHRFTPLVEPLSIDEAFLDVSGCRRLFGPAVTIGHLIKDSIAQEVGLTASVGVAHNKFLAKLASDLEKPDGFVVITPETAQPLLAELSVGRLWGVGKVSLEKLHRFGIRKVKDLLAVPRDLLVQEFGDHMDHLLALAVGQDERRVIPTHEAKSIGNETTFSSNISDQSHLEGVLDHLVDKVARRVRNHQLLARTVTLKARYGDFSTFTRSASFPEPTDSTVVIRDMARLLLREKLQRRGRALRLIGITVSNLLARDTRPALLFEDGEQVKNQELDELTDKVHKRFGAKLRRGYHPPTPKGSSGSNPNRG